MNNQNNEGIIIEGGVETTWVRATENSFPVELPVDLVNELTIGEKSDKHNIPTMKGFLIFIGMDAQTGHSGRIKVARSNIKPKLFRDHKYYDEFYYYKGEIQRKDSGKDSKTKFSKKEIRQIEEFYMRNIDNINLNSNSTKEEKRIDDEELYKRIYQTELSYYKNGGR